MIQQQKGIKFLGIVFLVLIMVAAFTGCNSGNNNQPAGVQNNQQAAGSNFPLTITDSLGREIVISSEPGKIISMSPAITEILFAIGVDNKIAGVTNYCNYPSGAAKKDRIGDFLNPNIEMIVSIEPDIIFVADGVQEDFVKQFDKLGIIVITLDATTIAEVVENIKTAGLVCGAVQQAAAIAGDMTKRIDAIEAKTAGANNKPAVFFEVWDDPLMTAGPGSFIDDMINLSGGQNIAADAGKEFAEFNREVLLTRNPDIYIINDHAHTPEEVINRPGYGGLKAVRENHVYSIEDNLVTLPGPRLIEGLEEMARIIHPDLF